MSPLYRAILAGQNIKSLLDGGLSPNVYCEFPGVNWTPLHLAVYRGLPDVAELLLEAFANPNSETLPSDLAGAYDGLVGLTAVDIAVALDDERMVRLLVRRGGRPGGSYAAAQGCGTLRHELARARSVDVAESFVVEPMFLPLIEKAQSEQNWDESDRLLLRILCQEGEGERSLHLRIRGLLARGRLSEAIEEASLIFLSYRRAGRYLEALQVTRCMRRIDPDSARPYELEMEFLTALGWIDEARQSLHQLMALYQRQLSLGEMSAAQARFQILCRRPENRSLSRPPAAWTAPEALPISSGNLPALIEDEAVDLWGDLPRLWWGDGGFVS